MDPALSRAEQLLDYVPEHRRVVETLGWQPGIWGGFFLVVGILILSESRLPLSTITLQLLGVVFFVGVILACWQMAMHRNRTALVRDNGLIQVFRKRRLDMVVDPEEIGLEKADFVLMLKIGVPLLMCAAGFIAVGGTMLWEGKRANADNLCILALGLASGASLASASWTRFFSAPPAGTREEFTLARRGDRAGLPFAVQASFSSSGRQRTFLIASRIGLDT